MLAAGLRRQCGFRRRLSIPPLVLRSPCLASCGNRGRITPVIQAYSTASSTSTSPTPESTIPSVSVLPDTSIETFRDQAFSAHQPYVLPSGAFSHLPVIHTWFTTRSSSSDRSTASTQDANAQAQEARTHLNIPHFKPHTEHPVAIEITEGDGLSPLAPSPKTFNRIESAPLGFFLDYVASVQNWKDTKEPRPRTHQVYLAQNSLSSLPASLREELGPIPDYVREAGKGDVYDSSLWLGLAPTRTPLHRDPNPNLFVQLAGIKKVRVFTPEAGKAIFEEARKIAGTASSGRFRGEEMMVGGERAALERLVWGKEQESTARSMNMGQLASALVEADFTRRALDAGGYEATLSPGDAMFIPTGWWHAIRGITKKEGGQDGIVGSVNWWFR